MDPTAWISRAVGFVALRADRRYLTYTRRIGIQRNVCEDCAILSI